MDVAFFQELIGKIAVRGRQLLDLSAAETGTASGLQKSCQTLVSSAGEAASIALAKHILDTYENLDDQDRAEFFDFLYRDFQPAQPDVTAAAQAYIRNPSSETLEHLAVVVEPKLQELLRRLNRAPGGTSALVAMREDLLKHISEKPEHRPLDRDFMHLFNSWFNRGFLVLSRLSWSSPASILERIIEYEAVHEIKGWDDLRRRLDPADRRCYAFFHPALVDDPLIFVEVALTDHIPSSIQSVIDMDATPNPDGTPPTVAVFYSISNCHEGLRGVSFGNFLIKQVVEELSRDLPTLAHLRDAVASARFPRLGLPGVGWWGAGLPAGSRPPSAG
jgi:malonyl-CoA decarboxylase